jgi:bacteriocin-like protein
MELQELTIQEMEQVNGGGLLGGCCNDCCDPCGGIDVKVKLSINICL